MAIYVESDGYALAGQTTFTVYVLNQGPHAVAGAHVTSAVALVNPSIPVNSVFTAIGSDGTSGFSASGTGDVDDLVNLPPGGTITYTVLATTNPSTQINQVVRDSASVTAPSGFNDSNPWNDTASADSSVYHESDLSVSIADNAGGSSASGAVGSIPAGGTVVYTIVLTNNGPSSIDDFGVMDTLPSGFTARQYTFTYRSQTSSPIRGDLNDFHYLPLLPGESVTYTITGQLDPSASGSLVDNVSAYGAAFYESPYDTASATISDQIG